MTTTHYTSEHSSSTNSVIVEELPPIREADLALGSILVLCCLICVPANCAACYHFITQPTKNKNSAYFKRIYTIISVIDVLIGVAQIPIAQALLLGRNSPNLLFENGAFCHFWYFLWLLLRQGAVFMVAFLSISRLSILITRNRLMRLRTAWLVPAVFTGSVLIVLGVLPLATRYAVVSYVPSNAMCRIAVYDQAQASDPTISTPPIASSLVTPTTTTADHRPYFVRSSILAITESCFFGLPVFPIFVSFVLSLTFLKQANKRSLRMTQTNIRRPSAGTILPRKTLSTGNVSTVNGGENSKEIRKRGSRPLLRRSKPVTKHKEASVTILTVTLTYVIFNIPALCMTVYLAYLYSQCLALIHSPHYSAPLLYEYAATVYRTFGPAWQYTWLLVYGVSHIFNSTVNPLLYWWRMRHFQKFVARGSLRFSESSRNLRAHLSRSYISLSSSFEMRRGLRGSSKYKTVDGK